MKKISYYDLQNTPVKELQKQYKLTTRDMEQQVRNHMDGAKAEERSELYKSVFSKQKE